MISPAMCGRIVLSEAASTLCALKRMQGGVPQGLRGGRTCEAGLTGWTTGAKR